MSTQFDRSRALIVLTCRLAGPNGRIAASFALDTGATRSTINWEMAVLLGYDPAISRDRIQVTTASGVEFAPRILVQSVEALGEVRRNFPLVCHTLPPSAHVDGLLGLDFLRGKRLVIDFRTGTIDLD